MNKYFILLIAIILIYSNPLNAQFSVTNDGSSADPSAMLDVKSTNKGALLPRMTLAQIGAIVNPANGLVAFCTTDNKFYAYVANTGVWKEILYGTGTINPPFVCGNPFVDSRDGKSYTTVLIGTQCWMAQNLNVGTKINSPANQTNNNIIEKFCNDNLESNCDVYGGLYQWAETVQYLNGATNGASWDPIPTGNVYGICPSGWHLPSIEEYFLFVGFVIITEYGTGGSTKSTGTIEAGTGLWHDPNTDATNESGFTALPGGSWDYYNNNFTPPGWGANFWLSQNNNEYVAEMIYLYYADDDFLAIARQKVDGFSVRCLKDN